MRRAHCTSPATSPYDAPRRLLATDPFQKETGLTCARPCFLVQIADQRRKILPRVLLIRWPITRLNCTHGHYHQVASFAREVELALRPLDLLANQPLQASGYALRLDGPNPALAMAPTADQKP